MFMLVWLILISSAELVALKKGDPRRRENPPHSFPGEEGNKSVAAQHEKTENTS